MAGDDRMACLLGPATELRWNSHCHDDILVLHDYFTSSAGPTLSTLHFIYLHTSYRNTNNDMTSAKHEPDATDCEIGPKYSTQNECICMN